MNEYYKHCIFQFFINIPTNPNIVDVNEDMAFIGSDKPSLLEYDELIFDLKYASQNAVYLGSNKININIIKTGILNFHGFKIEI